MSSNAHYYSNPFTLTNMQLKLFTVDTEGNFEWLLELIATAFDIHDQEETLSLALHKILEQNLPVRLFFWGLVKIFL